MTTTTNTTDTGAEIYMRFGTLAEAMASAQRLTAKWGGAYFFITDGGMPAYPFAVAGMNYDWLTTHTVAQWASIRRTRRR